MKKSKPKSDPMIAGESIEQWNRKWIDVPGGFAVKQPSLDGEAGLYRAIENGEIIAIGKGAGLRSRNRLSKRLDDFLRPGDSGRRDNVGKYIHAHLHDLKLQVLKTGTNLEACKVANKLRKPMIDFHNPRENRPEHIRLKAAFG